MEQTPTPDKNNHNPNNEKPSAAKRLRQFGDRLLGAFQRDSGIVRDAEQTLDIHNQLVDSLKKTPTSVSKFEASDDARYKLEVEEVDVDATISVSNLDPQANIPAQIRIARLLLANDVVATVATVNPSVHDMKTGNSKTRRYRLEDTQDGQLQVSAVDKCDDLLKNVGIDTAKAHNGRVSVERGSFVATLSDLDPNKESELAGGDDSQSDAYLIINRMLEGIAAFDDAEA